MQGFASGGARVRSPVKLSKCLGRGPSNRPWQIEMSHCVYAELQLGVIEPAAELRADHHPLVDSRRQRPMGRDIRIQASR